MELTAADTRRFFLKGQQDNTLCPSLYRRGDCAFFRPSTFQTIPERSLVDTCAATPLLHVVRFAKRCEETIVSFISTLLNSRHPTAVFRFVVAVDIVALYRVSERWLSSHIREKVLKPLPPLTHSNAASAVPVIRRCVRVSATLDHVEPRRVFWRTISVLGVAVRCATCDNPFAQEASARTRISGTKVDGSGLNFAPAFASTVPYDVRLPSRSAVASDGTKHGQPSKDLARFDLGVGVKVGDVIHDDHCSTNEEQNDTLNRFSTPMVRS